MVCTFYDFSLRVDVGVTVPIIMFARVVQLAFGESDTFFTFGLFDGGSASIAA